MNQIVFPHSVFERLLVELVNRQPGLVLVTVGIQQQVGGRMWLARKLLEAPRPETTLEMFQITLGPDPFEVSPWPDRVTGLLHIDDRSELIWGAVRDQAGIKPIRRIRLVGAGMHMLRVLGLRHLCGPTLQPGNNSSPSTPPQRRPLNRQPGRWSRTIGALGGPTLWRRLCNLRYAIIGVGRSGSQIAAALARLGVRRIALIDEDVVEEHCLGEMDAVWDATEFLGMPKAKVVVECLRRELSRVPIRWKPIAAPITDPRAIAVAKTADVLFCCVDNDAARLCAALVSAHYHKILIDLGTGVQLAPGQQEHNSPRSTSPPEREMGADVRLIVPGNRCLLCCGGFTDYAHAVEELCRNPSSRAISELKGAWRRERAGSLRSLNAIGAGLAVRMLEDLVAERIHESLWAHLEFNSGGQLSIRYQSGGEQRSTNACPLCARSGLGDNDW